MARKYSIPKRHIDGLVQDRSISSALALAILQSCAKPSEYIEMLNRENGSQYAKNLSM